MDELPPTWCEEDLEARGQGLVRTKKGRLAEGSPSLSLGLLPRPGAGQREGASNLHHSHDHPRRIPLMWNLDLRRLLFQSLPQPSSPHAPCHGRPTQTPPGCPPSRPALWAHLDPLTLLLTSLLLLHPKSCPCSFQPHAHFFNFVWTS